MKGMFMLLAYLLPLAEIGLKRANPYASQKNNFKVVEGDGPCCNVTADPPCEDTVVLPHANETFDGVTFNGVYYSVRDPLYGPQDSVTGLPTEPEYLSKAYRLGLTLNQDEVLIQNWLAKLFQTLEADPGCSVTVSGTDTIIVHTGAVTMLNAKTITLDANGEVDGGATVVATQCCDIMSIYEYAANFVDVTAIAYDGTSVNTADYAYSGVPATDAATAVTAQAAIIVILDGLGLANVTATVTVDDDLELFAITFTTTTAITGPVTFDGVDAVWQETTEGFVC